MLSRVTNNNPLTNKDDTNSRITVYAAVDEIHNHLEHKTLRTQDNRHNHLDEDLTINCTIAKGQEAVYL